MKIICAVLLAVMLTFELDAQTNFYQSHLNLQPWKLKTAPGKFKESVHHIGIEYAAILGASGQLTFHDYIHTLWGSFEISIAEKKLYFRLETGIIADRNFREGAGIAALGFNYRIIKSDRHIVYLFFGLEGWASGSYGGFFGIINPKYVFMLNNSLGLSAGLRYMPWISFDPFDVGKGFLCPSAGVQFFY